MKNLIFIFLFSLSLITQAQFQKPGGGVMMYDDAEKLPMTGWGIDFTVGYAMVTGGSQNVNNPDPRNGFKLSSTYARKGSRSYNVYVTKRTDYPGCCEWTRSEVMWMTPDQQNIQNEWRWAAVSILIDPSFQFETRRMMIGYDHKESPDDQQTPFGLLITGDRYVISGRFTGGVIDLGKVEKGVWVDWLLERNWKGDNSGYMKFYKNGVLVWSRTGPNADTRSGSKPICRIQHGIYKWVWATSNGQGEGTGSPLPGQASNAPDAPISIYLDEIRFGGPSATIDKFLIGGTVPPPPPPTNQAPIANAGINQSITLPTSATTLTGSGNDPDGNIIKYEWVKIAGPTSVAIQPANTASTDVSALTAGTYIFRLAVTDDKGAIGTDDIQVIVNSNVPPPPPPPVGTIVVNSGSTSDKNFSGGSLYSTSVVVTNTNNPSLYKDERFGNFSYAIPVIAGNYIVNLHFAEIYWTAINKRKFDVSIEGQPKLTNYDVFAKAGAANKAVVETFSVISDGLLNLVFTTKLDNSTVSAIEIIPSDGVPPPPVDTRDYIKSAVVGTKTIMVNGVSKVITIVTITFNSGKITVVE